MATYRVDADALRGLASRLDEMVAVLGDAAAIARILTAAGYPDSASVLTSRMADAGAWGRSWSASLLDRAGAVSRQDALFREPLLVSSDRVRGADRGYEFATLSPTAVTIEDWRADAGKRTSEVARLAAWLASGPDAAMVAATMAGVASDVRAELARHQPEIVGSLPGVPLDVRIPANRILLAGLDFALLTRIEALEQAASASPWAAWASAAELERLRNERAVVQQLGASGTNVVLLAADPLRIAAWVGPLDAKHVVLLAPGVALAGSSAESALRAAQTMVRLDPTAGELAVVAAQVYESPPSIAAGASGSYAAAGGPAFADFAAGLPLAGSHVTIVGHSYGSTVVGEALRRGLIGELVGGGDLVILGSPGVGADTVAGLGVDPGRVWVGLDPNDEIRYAVAPLALPSLAACATFSGLLGPCDATEWLIHGRNPSHPNFGARIFEATSDARTGWLVHDDYFATVWEDGAEAASPALRNVLHIATGRYDMVSEPPRT